MGLKYVVYKVQYYDYESDVIDKVDEFSSPEEALNYSESLGDDESGGGGHYHNVVVERDEGV